MTDILETPIDGSSPVKLPVITLSDAAVAKARELRDATGEAYLALRVAVKPGGCSGLSYDLFFTDEKSEDDKVVTYGDFEVLVDPESATLLVGATLEYEDGLNKSGFTVSNPNATRTCGCGSSFC